MKKRNRLIAALLLVAKLISFAGCSTPHNSGQDEKVDNSISTSVSDSTLESNLETVTKTLQAPIIDYSLEGLSIQKEEVYIDELTGNTIAVVRYLQDETGNLVSADIYSYDLAMRTNSDVEKEITKHLLPKLNEYTYYIDGYEGESKLKSYTIYQPTDEYPIAKCLYSYSKEGELTKTTYLDSKGNIISVIEKRNEQVDPNTNENTIADQLFFYTSKTGVKYAERYVGGIIKEISFYGNNDDVIDSITIGESATYVEIIDDNGLFQVKTSSDVSDASDDITYTITNGKIIYNGITDYKPETNKEEILSTRVTKLAKREIICGGKSFKFLEISIDYYTETVKASNGKTFERMLKTEITSNYLDNPITIYYEQNEDGSYKPRENQMKTDAITSKQGFAENLEEEIEYYIKKIEKKYSKETGDSDVNLTSHYKTFQYSSDGRLQNEEEYDEYGLATGKEYSYDNDGNYEYILTYYRQNGNPFSQTYYRNDKATLYIEYLISKNGCHYTDIDDYEKNHRALFFNGTSSNCNDYIATDGILEKHNVGDYLVIYTEDRDSNNKTVSKNIYKVNPEGHIQYTTSILEIYNGAYSCVFVTQDCEGKTINHQEYKISEFDLEEEKKLLPWFPEYNDSWETKTITNEDSGLSNQKDAELDASIKMDFDRTSSYGYENGEVYGVDLQNETDCSAKQLVIVKLKDRV